MSKLAPIMFGYLRCNTPRVFGVLLVVLVLSGCSALYRDYTPRYGESLADLKDVEIPEDSEEIPQRSIREIENTYRSALSVAKDPSMRHRILIRLADLEMSDSEREQIEVAQEKAYFDSAISMYESLLKENPLHKEDPDSPSNERLLYQLSKALALEGNIEKSTLVLEQLVTQFPDSIYVSEAEFRRAEEAFAIGDYRLSEQLYNKVQDTGDDSPFHLNATYMLGWSRFKLQRYDEAIETFTQVLDNVLIEGIPSEQLSNTKRNLAADTLHVMSLCFSYIDGAQSITETYARLGPRHYQYMQYLNLGELYLEKQRYRDSADTFQHYVDKYPETDQAPVFSVRAIDAYSQGNFPSLILPAKQAFINNYVIDSPFWQQVRPLDLQREVFVNLRKYLDELSSYYHATAINQQKSWETYQKQLAQGKKPKSKPAAYIPAYIQAAEYYNEFSKAFPDDKATPEMVYLMGEAYFAAEDMPKAIGAYEKVAYTYQNAERSADAGYAIVFAVQQMIDSVAEEERVPWQNQKVISAVRFADTFTSDVRALPVLTQAAEETFALKDFSAAIQLASRVTQWQPEASAELRKTAWVVVAHSQFELERYDLAEQSYQQARQLMPPEDPLYRDISDRLAASLYKGAELQLASGDTAAAVDRFLSIREVAPQSDIAIKGQYDAANQLMEAKDWGRAEQVLKDFQVRYPSHALTSTLAPKFVVIYQETKQWAKAASALKVMSAQSDDPETQRQSLYLSAELYEKAGDTKKALLQYRSYANTYPQPFDIAMEARFKLAELYKVVKDDYRREYWLQKLITFDRKAGASRTDRSKYLAAFAMNEFAKNYFRVFEKIKLTLPIKRSLKKKKSALEKALKTYKKVMDYGVAEFATEANHGVGMIYLQLSRDLMASQRPKNLDALALDQYEILLEEQAYPFEEKAIDFHTNNAQRAWKGIYDDWVKNSFKALSELLPARFGKQEKTLGVSRGIY